MLVHCEEICHFSADPPLVDRKEPVAVIACLAVEG